jgi:hypothetical protein
MLTKISKLLVLAAFTSSVTATSVLYDGRIPLNYTQADLDNSVDPFLT